MRSLRRIVLFALACFAIVSLLGPAVASANAVGGVAAGVARGPCGEHGRRTLHMMASLRPPLSAAQDSQVCAIVDGTTRWFNHNPSSDRATQIAHVRSAVAQIRAVLNPAQQAQFDAQLSRMDPNHFFQ